MSNRRRRHRNTGKNIDTADINNNPPQTWGRTDYIKGDITLTGNTWDTIKTQTKTNQTNDGEQEEPYKGEETKVEEDKV